MADGEKRASERKMIAITTVIKKLMPDSSYQLMEFLSHNLSRGGVFILAEDLSLFDLGDELEILVELRGDKYYEGRARVVRSARIFAGGGQDAASGYGLMFLTPSEEFRDMLLKKLDTVD